MPLPHPMYKVTIEWDNDPNNAGTPVNTTSSTHKLAKAPLLSETMYHTDGRQGKVIKVDKA